MMILPLKLPQGRPPALMALSLISFFAGHSRHQERTAAALMTIRIGLGLDQAMFLLEVQVNKSNNFFPRLSLIGKQLKGKPAKLLSQINETFSCMSFESPFPDFVNLYSMTENGNGQYSITYRCKTASNSITIVIAVIAAVLLVGLGVFLSRIFFQKKKTDSELQEALMRTEMKPLP